MIINFHFKGQTVPVTINDNLDVKKVYESSLQKFRKQLNQELLIYGINNLRLRLQRTNSYLNWHDISGRVLFDKDTVLIEPKESALKINNINSHTPKRYSSCKTELQNPVNGVSNATEIKEKSPDKVAYPTKSVESGKVHRYQKSDQYQNLSKSNQNINNLFDRNGFRRSLGAAVAPQFDLPTTPDHSSRNAKMKDYSSDSSISDLPPEKQVVIRPRKFSDFPNNNTKSINFGNETASKSAPASPTKPLPVPRSPHTHLSMLTTHNVRTIGEKINISILKKPNVGLGFTIVTRDNPVIYDSTSDITNSVVILVNKILPDGGAADDGRLRPGDRILQVNGQSSISLKDVTEKLRAIPENGKVELLISRLQTSQAPVISQSPSKSKTMPISHLTYEISLNSGQKENQHLGLNIHYISDGDKLPLGPGIYIHSIVSNGLAAVHGGLQEKDKLIGINGISISNMNVEATIDLLKSSMQNNSILTITVCREAQEKSDVASGNSAAKIPVKSSVNSSFQKPEKPNLLPNKMPVESNDKSCIYNDSSTDSMLFQDDSDKGLNSSGFSREGRGRRSMSEKRKAHENATQYNFYKVTRMGVPNVSEDRLYSTLPSISHLKKMQLNNPPPIPNKSQTPVKPSQIKHMNVPKSQNSPEQPPKVVPRTPTRSVSLRNSPTRVKNRDTSQSPKRISQTPTHETLPVFNRAMNNSFKRAVEKTLPENEEPYASRNSNTYPSKVQNSSVASPRYQSQKSPAPSPTKASPISNYVTQKNQVSEAIPRSYSVKTPDGSRKNFNIKDFLTFTPNVVRSKKFNKSEKSDTFPPDNHSGPNPPNYSYVDQPDSTYHFGPIHHLPADSQFCNDPVILNSTKRVLEWQKKNADVISKESKSIDSKVYQNVGPPSNKDAAKYEKRRKSKIFNISLLACCSTQGKIKVDSNTNLRNQNSNKSPYVYQQETDPYESVDGTLSKHKGNRIHSRSNTGGFSHNGGLVSSNDPVFSGNHHSKKPLSASSAAYATVRKSSKIEQTSKSQLPKKSLSHKNKYKF